jgi:hypothetical protein
MRCPISPGLRKKASRADQRLVSDEGFATEVKSICIGLCASEQTVLGDSAVMRTGSHGISISAQDAPAIPSSSMTIAEEASKVLLKAAVLGNRDECH